VCSSVVMAASAGALARQSERNACGRGYGAPLAERKSRTDRHICASWSGLDLASLNHSKPRQYRLAIGRARALMCLSKDTVCRRRLLLFLLAGLLLCLLRFLSHVALRYPKVGSMQVDPDMHKYRVHHNCKIDTSRFEEGKRRSHHSAFSFSLLEHRFEFFFERSRRNAEHAKTRQVV
jgi:hypothetical protein